MDIGTYNDEQRKLMETKLNNIDEEKVIEWKRF